MPDGDFAAARRWYADHVHQLLGFPGLAAAALYQCVGDGAPDGAAPELLCFYDFGDAARFAAYEASEVKRAAERDRLAGWGRDGIAICLRAPYERLYASARDAASAGWPAQCRATALAGTPSALVERALAAGAYERGVDAYAVLRAVAGDGYLWLESPGDPSRAAEVPGLTAAWHCALQRLHAWQR